MAWTAEQIESEVRAYLRRNAPGQEDEVDTLPGDAAVWGVVDSLLVLDLVVYVEKRFDMVVAPDDLTPEHFHSIDAIVGYVSSRRG